MVTPPERSGSDLLMQSAGLLIICHMREETTHPPAKFVPGSFALDRFIRRIRLIHTIVDGIDIPVKRAVRSPALLTFDAFRPGYAPNHQSLH